MTTFKLEEPWFTMIKCGIKKYEIRLGNPIIKGFKKDTYAFIKNKTDEKANGIKTHIHSIKWHRSFEEAFNSVPYNECMPTADIDIKEMIAEYNSTASLDEQKRRGIAVLKINLC